MGDNNLDHDVRPAKPPRSARKRIIERRWAEQPGICTADSKRSGKRCTRKARDGFKVCGTHGAGYEQREQAGEKRGAGEGTLVHGLYARRHRPFGDDAVKEYEATGEELYRLDSVTARAWVHLEHTDQVAAVALQVLKDLQEGEGDIDPLALRHAATALNGVESALARIDGLIQTRAKLQNGDRSVSPAELVAMLRLVTAWVREIVADESVPRERIPDQLIARIQAYADAQQQASASRA
jgi:hypothetical protein